MLNVEGKGIELRIFVKILVFPVYSTKKILLTFIGQLKSTI